MGANLPLQDYDRAKRAAIEAQPGTPLYPRLFVRDGCWWLQRTPSTLPIIQSTNEALAVVSGEIP